MWLVVIAWRYRGCTVVWVAVSLSWSRRRSPARSSFGLGMRRHGPFVANCMYLNIKRLSSLARALSHHTSSASSIHPPPRPLASPCFDYTAVLHFRTTHLHPILPDCQLHPPWVSSRAAFCAWCKHYYMPSASPAPALPSVCANLSRHANIHT